MEIYNKKIWETDKVLILGLVFSVAIAVQTLASTTPTFNQTINSSSLSVDIVDADGNSVASPSVTFDSKTFSFSSQDSNGDFAPSAQRIRTSNPTATATWTVNLAGSTPGAHWTSGGNTYHFDDATGSGYTNGQMTIDPSGGTISGVPNNTACPVTNISAGSSDSFANGTRDSIDIFSASAGAATSCMWDYIGANNNITQKIPASQAVGSYSIDMTVSVE